MDTAAVLPAHACKDVPGGQGSTVGSLFADPSSMWSLRDTVPSLPSRTVSAVPTGEPPEADSLAKKESLRERFSLTMPSQMSTKK